jgi:hypothetical protein
VDRLQEDLAALGDVLDGSGVDAVRDGLQTLVGLVRQADAAALAVAGDEAFRGELDELLQGLSDAIAELAIALESAHFALAAAPQPYSLSGSVSW